MISTPLKSPSRLELIFDPSSIVPELLVEELVTLEEAERLNSRELTNASKLRLLFFCTQSKERGIEKIIGILERKDFLEAAEIIDKMINPTKDTEISREKTEPKTGRGREITTHKHTLSPRFNRSGLKTIFEHSTWDAKRDETGDRKLFANLKQRLQTVYKSDKFARITPIPGYCYSVILDDIHINLTKEGLRLRIYKDSLEEMSATNHVIWVCGSSGIGKSTFARRLCHDWACGTLDFWDCALIVDGRAIEETEGAGTTKKISLDELAVNELKRFASEHYWSNADKIFADLESRSFLRGLGKVLLIVDNFNPATSDWAIQNRYGNVTTLLLSDDLPPTADAVLELNGLSDNQQEVIIRYHLKKKSKNIQVRTECEARIQDLLERSPTIRKALRVPILLSYFVASFDLESDDQLLRLTDVLNGIIAWVMSRHDQKSALLSLLQETAFKSLTDPNACIFPRDVSLETPDNDDPLELSEGIFFRPETYAAGPILRLHFPHIVIQSFLAASYVQQVFLQREKFPSLSQTRKTDGLEFFFRFLSGLSQDWYAKDLVHYLQRCNLLPIASSELFSLHVTSFHCQVFEESNSSVFRTFLSQQFTRKRSPARVKFEGTLAEAKVFMNLLGAAELEVCYMYFKDENLQDIPSFIPLPPQFIPDVQLVWLFIEFPFYSERIIQYIQSIAKPLFFWFIEGVAPSFKKIIEMDPALLAVTIGKLSHTSLYLSSENQFAVPVVNLLTDSKAPIETTETDPLHNSFVPRLRNDILVLSGQSRNRYSDLFVFDIFLGMAQTQRLGVAQPKEGTLEEVLQFGANVLEQSDHEFVKDFLRRRLQPDEDAEWRVVNENDPILQACSLLQENMFLWREICEMRLGVLHECSKVAYVGNGGHLSELLELLAHSSVSELTVRLQGGNEDRGWMELPSCGKICSVRTLRLNLSQITPDQPFLFPLERFRILEALVVEDLSGGNNREFLPSLQACLPPTLKSLLFNNVKLPAGSALDTLFPLIAASDPHPSDQPP